MQLKGSLKGAGGLNSAQRLELFPNDPKLVGSILADFLDWSCKFWVVGKQASPVLLKAA